MIDMIVIKYQVVLAGGDLYLQLCIAKGYLIGITTSTNHARKGVIFYLVQPEARASKVETVHSIHNWQIKTEN